jgi:hypothetical protein
MTTKQLLAMTFGGLFVIVLNVWAADRDHQLFDIYAPDIEEVR